MTDATPSPHGGAFAHHYEASGRIGAAPEAVFDFIDDPAALASHMQKSSWRMAGSRMTTRLDDAQGRSVGSRIWMGGTMMGLRLELEEVVTRRERPHRKSWSTIGRPRLLVVDHYSMGFELSPVEGGSELRVFIDYRLPSSGFGWLLGLFLGNWYARWCVDRMLQDAAAHFRDGGTSSRSGRTT